MIFAQFVACEEQQELSHIHVGVLCKNQLSRIFTCIIVEGLLPCCEVDRVNLNHQPRKSRRTIVHLRHIRQRGNVSSLGDLAATQSLGDYPGGD